MAKKDKPKQDAVFMTIKDILWIMIFAVLYELGAQYHGKTIYDYSLGVLFIYFLYKINQIVVELKDE